MPSAAKNIFYLVFVQGIIYLSPLVSLPYLTRTLQVEQFAALSFAQVIVQYFVLVTDYGFGITATRLIALSSNDRDQISSVTINTLAAKLFLSLIMGILCVLACVFVDELRNNASLLAACFIGVVGNALFPNWLFQGLERMRALAFITAVSRLLPLPLIFILVSSPHDVVVAAFLLNVPGIFAGFFCYLYVRHHNVIVIAPIDCSSVKMLLCQGWPVFLANISTSFYTSVNLVLLRIFGTSEQVAFFAASDRIRVAVQGFIQPIASALFPRFAAMGEVDIDRAALHSLFKQGALYLLGMQLAGGLFMFLFADEIARHYLGSAFSGAALYLKALALLPLVIGVAAMISQWRFLALGKSIVLSRVYLIAGPVHILHASYLTYRFQSSGLIASLYLTEISITIAMILIARRQKIILF